MCCKSVKCKVKRLTIVMDVNRRRLPPEYRKEGGALDADSIESLLVHPADPNKVCPVSRASSPFRVHRFHILYKYMYECECGNGYKYSTGYLNLKPVGLSSGADRLQARRRATLRVAECECRCARAAAERPARGVPDGAAARGTLLARLCAREHVANRLQSAIRRPRRFALSLSLSYIYIYI